MDRPAPDKARSKSGRRDLMRLGAAAVLGGLVASRAVLGRSGATPGGRKVTVLPSCLGCTGCIALCPKRAITSTPSGIAVADELCIRCGYCVAACPVSGLFIHREPAGG